MKNVVVSVWYDPGTLYKCYVSLSTQVVSLMEMVPRIIIIFEILIDLLFRFKQQITLITAGLGLGLYMLYRINVENKNKSQKIFKKKERLHILALFWENNVLKMTMYFRWIQWVFNGLFCLRKKIFFLNPELNASLHLKYFLIWSFRFSLDSSAINFKAHLIRAHAEIVWIAGFVHIGEFAMLSLEFALFYVFA